MTYPWNQFSLTLGLKKGPQPVTLNGTTYTCYAGAAGGQFIATLPSDLAVYLLDVDTQQVATLMRGAGTVHAPTIAVWQVSAADLCSRAAEAGGLTQKAVRTAITAHIAAGLVVPASLTEELTALLTERPADGPPLARRLAGYRSDLPGSRRQLSAFADAVILVAGMPAS